MKFLTNVWLIPCLHVQTVTPLRIVGHVFNTLRPRHNGRHFADDILKYIFLNKNVWISIEISLKFVPEVPINNIPALVQIMAWRRPGDKPLSEPMMMRLSTHICVTRPHWVKKTARHKIAHYCSHMIATLLAVMKTYSRPTPLFHACRVINQIINALSPQGCQN